jgi:hypothetical protein
MMNRTGIALVGLVALLVMGGPVCAQPEPSGTLPFDNPLLASDEAEQTILTALEEMRVGPQHYNVSVRDGRLLRLLTEAVNAQRVVEIGTSTGESAVWFALALRTTGGLVIAHNMNRPKPDPRYVEAIT